MMLLRAVRDRSLNAQICSPHWRPFSIFLFAKGRQNDGGSNLSEVNLQKSRVACRVSPAQGRVAAVGRRAAAAAGAGAAAGGQPCSAANAAAGLSRQHEPRGRGGGAAAAALHPAAARRGWALRCSCRRGAGGQPGIRAAAAGGARTCRGPRPAKMLMHAALTGLAPLMQRVNTAVLCSVPAQHRHTRHARLQAAMAALDAEAETDATAFADAAAATGLASDPAARATMAQRLGLQVERHTTVSAMRETLDSMSCLLCNSHVSTRLHFDYPLVTVAVLLPFYCRGWPATRRSALRCGRPGCRKRMRTGTWQGRSQGSRRGVRRMQTLLQRRSRRRRSRSPWPRPRSVPCVLQHASSLLASEFARPSQDCKGRHVSIMMTGGCRRYSYMCSLGGCGLMRKHAHGIISHDSLRLLLLQLHIETMTISDIDMI